jgi:DNA-binding transcriptional ArsR family regulator
MGIWVLDADVLARSRFRVSGLAEVVGALLVLAGRRPNRPGQLPDPARIRAAFRAKTEADPVARDILRAAFRPHWIADFLCTPPADDTDSFPAELARIRSTPADVLRSDLPGAALPDDLPARVADLLEWVWREAVAPDWPRRKRAFEADIIARTQRLSTGGWAAALSDMRPGMRWLGEGRLQINVHDYPPLGLDAGRLLLIPTTATQGWVGWELDQQRYSIVYPCGGLLAEGRSPAPDALRRLIGPARATLLGLLGAPMSTTHLVSATGFTLGAVGNHLKVLLDAQLVHRRRAGRSVLYYRAPDGDRLVHLTASTQDTT